MDQTKRPSVHAHLSLLTVFNQSINVIIGQEREKGRKKE